MRICFIWFGNTADERNALINSLRKQNINSVFHYLSLHKSEYYKMKHDGRELPNSDQYTDCLLRLPFYYELSTTDIERICNCIKQHFSVAQAR